MLQRDHAKHPSVGGLLHGSSWFPIIVVYNKSNFILRDILLLDTGIPQYVHSNREFNVARERQGQQGC